MPPEKLQTNRLMAAAVSGSGRISYLLLRMIVVKLMGGLGNQMFQYALGRHLAEKHQTVLKMDLSFLLERTPKENFIFRDYELGIFNIQQNIISPSELEKYFGNPAGFKKIIKKVENTFAKHHYVLEQDFSFNPDILHVRNNSYLDGYWQSELYFKDCEAIIRKDFSFKYQLSPGLVQLSEKILNGNAVAVHVRKTDFVNSNYHHNLGKEYYRKAEALIKETLSRPHLYLFSDDVEWCIKHLSFDIPTTYMKEVSDKDKTKDCFQLMAQCKHFIIANSSFSWWAAWLNSDKEKTVIAPEKWFINPMIDTKDLIPPSWIRI